MEVNIALCAKVEAELAEERFIPPVKYSELASPVVLIVNLSGKRLCGDYKLMVNRAFSLKTLPHT